MEFMPRRWKGELIFTGKPCRKGHIGPRYAKFGGCVECVRETNKRQIAKRKPGENAFRLRKWVSENREYSNARRLEHRIKNPERIMVIAAKKTAKSRGLPFDLTYKDIVIPEFCPVLGVKLERGMKSRTDASPSLDRIIPENGYVRGNIIVVSWRANFLKSDGSVDELRKIADFYERLDVQQRKG